MRKSKNQTDSEKTIISRMRRMNSDSKLNIEVSSEGKVWINSNFNTIKMNKEEAEWLIRNMEFLIKESE